MPPIEALPKLNEARQQFAHGPQADLFDAPNCLAFVRQGKETESGCVVVLTNAEEMTE